MVLPTTLSGCPVSAGFPVCRLKKSANQAIGGTTTTLITWDQEVRDDLDWHSNTVNNSRITVDEAGLYLIVCHVRVTVNISTSYNNYVAVYVNGVYAFEGPWQGTQAAQVIGTLNLSANDYLTIVIYNAGGARTLNSGALLTEFTVIRLEAYG